MYQCYLHNWLHRCPACTQKFSSSDTRLPLTGEKIEKGRPDGTEPEAEFIPTDPPCTHIPGATYADIARLEKKVAMMELRLSELEKKHS